MQKTDTVRIVDTTEIPFNSETTAKQFFLKSVLFVKEACFFMPL